VAPPRVAEEKKTSDDSASRLATVTETRFVLDVSQDPSRASVALTKINPFPFPDDTRDARSFFCFVHARDDENHP
jgi:hypothetical protein